MMQYNVGQQAQMLSRSGFMSEVEFWFIINEARNSTNDGEALAAQVVKVLVGRNIESILGFDYWFTKFFYNSYTSELWCAASIAKGGCNDDSFDYFRAWLIGQGREVFEAAISDPDSLVPALDAARVTGVTENESLLMAAAKAYEIKTGKDIEAFYEVLDNYDTDFGSFRALKFSWSEEDPFSMQRVCPKIFAKFFGKPVR
jgi:hypothetical protein